MVVPVCQHRRVGSSSIIRICLTVGNSPVKPTAEYSPVKAQRAALAQEGRVLGFSGLGATMMDTQSTQNTQSAIPDWLVTLANEYMSQYQPPVSAPPAYWYGNPWYGNQYGGQFYGPPAQSTGMTQPPPASPPQTPPPAQNMQPAAPPAQQKGGYQPQYGKGGAQTSQAAPQNKGGTGQSGKGGAAAQPTQPTQPTQPAFDPKTRGRYI